jgi:hypothetical protein
MTTRELDPLETGGRAWVVCDVLSAPIYLFPAVDWEAAYVSKASRFTRGKPRVPHCVYPKIRK